MGRRTTGLHRGLPTRGSPFQRSGVIKFSACFTRCRKRHSRTGKMYNHTLVRVSAQSRFRTTNRPEAREARTRNLGSTYASLSVVCVRACICCRVCLVCICLSACLPAYREAECRMYRAIRRKRERCNGDSGIGRETSPSSVCASLCVPVRAPLCVRARVRTWPDVVNIASAHALCECIVE
jgi:hypothetical protein